MSTTRDIDVSAVLDKMLVCGDTDALNGRAADPEYRQNLVNASRRVTDRAFHDHDENAVRQVHAVLAKLYEWYFSLPSLDQARSSLEAMLNDVREVFENAMIDDLIARSERSSLRTVPEDPGQFLPWYRQFISQHTASDHPFYRDFLENRATIADVRLYLAQETVLDPRFDDILALLIRGTTGSEKMELVSNLWDELGNGNYADIHTSVFGETLHALEVTPEFIADNIMLEATICGNVSAALALSKRHYYRAIGYFGVTEYLTPRRFRSFVIGAKRLGIEKAAYRYHDMHIQIDARHGPSWFKNIVAAAVAREPRCAYEVALGTLLRMETSTGYLNALQKTLDVGR
jgi:pyrroloquinoline quinone (PQQ) biosynthesis protein C